MEGLGISSSFWKGKTVFLTGHTGFKGGWIAHWLTELGAYVNGYSLLPPTEKNLFTEIKIQERISSSTIGDICDIRLLSNCISQVKPDIVIHMAAQPLVRESYRGPIKTFGVNVIGTLNVLEAVRQVGTAKAIVNITTDKCYENMEWTWPYRENDRLGGYDPYSASKACAEIVTAAYRNSFLAEAGIHVASVRAGNVIGGGDWAADRLLPDFFRTLDAGTTLMIRSPNSIRPWQHVLEPISGYLKLAERLYEDGEKFAEAWNFGPGDMDSRPVGWIVEQLCERIPEGRWEVETIKQPHEASLLKLDSSKARARLGWAPRWDIETAINKTVDWHQAWRNKEDLISLTNEQITSYVVT